MVGICYADVRRRSRRYIGYNIVIYFAVIRIKPDIHLYVRIKRFKIGYCFFIYFCLSFVCIVLCPKGYLVVARSVKSARHFENRSTFRTVTSRKYHKCGYEQNKRKDSCADPFHPFVPPLETPAIIFLRKIRNSIISGSDTATTAAIIAGMFSLPKPFSLIS